MLASGPISQHVDNIDRSTSIDRFIDFLLYLTVAEVMGSEGGGQASQ